MSSCIESKSPNWFLTCRCCFSIANSASCAFIRRLATIGREAPCDLAYALNLSKSVYGKVTTSFFAFFAGLFFFILKCLFFCKNTKKQTDTSRTNNVFINIVVNNYFQHSTILYPNNFTDTFSRHSAYLQDIHTLWAVPYVDACRCRRSYLYTLHNTAIHII